MGSRVATVSGLNENNCSPPCADKVNCCLDLIFPTWGRKHVSHCGSCGLECLVYVAKLPYVVGPAHVQRSNSVSYLKSVYQGHIENCVFRIFTYAWCIAFSTSWYSILQNCQWILACILTASQAWLLVMTSTEFHVHCLLPHHVGQALNLFQQLTINGIRAPGLQLWSRRFYELETVIMVTCYDVHKIGS